MNEQDTIKLLRECDAGVKMGVDSIESVLKYVNSEKLRQILLECCEEHKKLQAEIDTLLDKCRDEGKDPNLVARGMSWIKTNVKLIMKESDSTIADLIIDGCDMGVKSLSRYLNEYPAADGRSKDIAKRLIQLETKLGEDMRGYL